MKTCFLLMLLSVCGRAQFNLLTNVPDDAKVAKVNGREVTAGEIRKQLNIMPDQFVQEVYNKDPKYAIQQMYMMQFLSEEAAKEKVDDDPDIKIQLKIARDNILAAAMLSFEQNHYTPPKEAVTDYYNRNQSRFAQAKVRVVSVTFKSPGGVGATDPNCDQKCLEEKMRQSIQAQANAANRTEAEALLRAKEAGEKLRGGADFDKIFAEYSDDPALKSTGGSITITQSSTLSKGTRAAVMALKPGEISAPLMQNAAYSVIVMGERSTQPQAEVQLSIMQDLRQQHLKEWLDSVTKKFEPEVENQQFFQLPAPQPAPAK